MTDDLVFMLCAGFFIFAVLGVGAVCGYALGYKMGEISLRKTA